MRVLLPGGNSLIEQALYRRPCEDEKNEGVSAVRYEGKSTTGITHCHVSDIHSQTAWKHALGGVDVVVHLAGCTHVIRDTGTQDKVLVD